MRLAILALCTALAGCDTLGKGKFDNVLVTSMSGDRAFVASMYGPIGLTTELRADDARQLRLMQERARDAEELVRYLARQQGSKP